MILFGKKSQPKKILFACVENSGRSQMAEAFFRKYAPDNYEAISGGTEPKGYINPIVMEAMKEVGIDMSGQKPKAISEDMIKQSEKSVNMGCMKIEICPTVMIPNMINWDIDDPKDQPLEKVREIRDRIEQNIKELVAQLP